MNKITQLYQDILPKLENIEQFRIKQLKHRKLFRIFTLSILLPILIGSFVYSWFYAGFMACLFSFILIGIFFSFYKDFDVVYEKNVYNEIQDQIIPEIGKAINEDLEYDADHHVSFAHFQNSHIRDVDITNFGGGNFFEGKIGNYPFQFSEVKLSREKGNIGDAMMYGGVYDTDVGFIPFTNYGKDKVITQGLFLVTTLPEFHDNASFVFNKEVLGVWKQKQKKKRGKHIPLGNEQFKKSFQVFGLDETMTRDFLTEQLQEHILKINDYFNATLRISIIGECAYVFLEKKEGIFNFNIAKSFLDEEGFVKEILTEILSLLSFVLILHENCKILEEE